MFEDIRKALGSLIVYRNILEDPVIDNLSHLLSGIVQNIDNILLINEYHHLLNLLFQTGHSYQKHIIDLLLHDDNPFSQQAEKLACQDMDTCLLKAVRRDLKSLQKVYKLNFKELENKLKIEDPVPIYSGISGESSMAELFENAGDWANLLQELAAYYAEKSRGIVSRFRALRWDKQKGLVGISYPDPVKLEELIGCEAQKELLCRNTLSFLEGYPANNVLLYGDRGTGKSSMVKALLNEYHDRELRLLELGRDNLSYIPEIVSRLRQYCLKFILFIDDLSFEDFETGYKDLKAVMEGSLEVQPANVLVYATSNRRHLVKELFSDRGKNAEEIHTNDSMQEKLSLADRFGITITFPSPRQRIYLDIVESLAERQKIDIDIELLRRKALEWERIHHGPSGRTARQFVNSLAYPGLYQLNGKN